MKNITIAAFGRSHKIHVPDDVTDVEITLEGNTMTTRYTSTQEFITRPARNPFSSAPKTDSGFKKFIKEQKRREKIKPKPPEKLPAKSPKDSTQHMTLEQRAKWRKNLSRKLKAYWAGRSEAEKKAHGRKLQYSKQRNQIKSPADGSGDVTVTPMHPAAIEQ